MKPLVLTEQNWAKLRYQLNLSQPRSVMLSRSKMREVLGFTPRTHTDWKDDEVSLRPVTMVHLDFFDDSKRTFFLLKYGDWIG